MTVVTSTATAAAPNLPGTNAPSAAQQIRENLLEKHPGLKPRADELIKQLSAIADPMPEGDIERVADLVVSVKKHLKSVEALRETEKEPYLEGGRIVDGYFNGIRDDLQASWNRMKPRQNKTVTERANRLQAEQEEAARKEREEAARIKREADARLEQQRREAEELQRQADEAERKRIEEQERLQEQQRAAEEAQRLAAEPKPEPAPEHEPPIETPSSSEIAVPATEATPAVVVPSTPSPALTLQQLLDQEEVDRLAGLEAKRLAGLAADKQAELAQTTRVAEQADHQAASAEARHHRVVTAPAASFAKVRSNYGALTTQREDWDFVVENWAKLPKAFLWKYIAKEAIEAAIRSAVQAHVREIQGVKIFKKREVQVR